MRISQGKMFRITAMGLALFCCLPILRAEPLKKRTLFKADTKNVVYFVPQFSEFKEISQNDLYFLKKTLKKAHKNNVKAVIFELDTPGGRVDIALKYVSILAKSKVPVIAYLNPQGISAGMIIAMGADRIAINPNGVIGDAMPIALGPGGMRPIADDSGQDNPEEVKEKKTEKKQEKSAKDKKEDKKKEGKKADKDNADKKAKEKKKIAPGAGSLEKILKELQKLKKDKPQEKRTEKEKSLAKQKFLTVFFKVLQVLAEKNDRPVRVVRAMADPYQKLTVKRDGIKHPNGRPSPLTLSAREAKKLNVVDYICDSRSQVLEKLGLGNCELKIIKKSATDQLASFLSHSAIAGILIVLGIIGIYIEIKTPGFGVPGILGLTALTLFFLGHIGSGASEWGPIVIFFVGLMLLCLEIFVIPGFGIIGILGIACIVISFFGAFGVENIETAAYTIGSSIIVAGVLIVALTVYVLPRSSLFRRIKLETRQKSADGFMAHEKANMELMHKQGVAHTTLRPVGIAIIDDHRYEVSTEGDYIEKGLPIEVMAVTAMKIIVKRAKT